MAVSDAQKSALRSMRQALDDLEIRIDTLQQQQTRQHNLLINLTSDFVELGRSLSTQIATLRGSMAAGERWGKPRTQIFLTAEELELAKAFGLTEKEFAEQKTIAERLGIDLASKLKKQQKQGLGSPEGKGIT